MDKPLQHDLLMAKLLRLRAHGTQRRMTGTGFRYAVRGTICFSHDEYRVR